LFGGAASLYGYTSLDDREAMNMRFLLRPVRGAVPGAAPFCLLLAGCYIREEQDGATTFSMALWIPALVALSGLALLGIGVLVFRRWHKPLGVLLLIAGPVLLVCVPPMMILNKVTVVLLCDLILAAR
jgi:hypothetical protein